MKPTLIRDKKHVFLVDPTEVFTTSGKSWFLSAIDLGPLDLQMGSLLFTVQNKDGKLLYPRPCIYARPTSLKMKEIDVHAAGLSYDQAQAMLATAARCCSIEIVGKYDKDLLRREYKLSQLEDARVPFSSIDFTLACFWGRFEQEGSTWAERAEFLTRFVGEEVSANALKLRAPKIGLTRKG